MRYLIIAIIYFTSVSCYAQGVSENIEKYVNSYVNTGDYSGCIQVLKKDKIRFEKCFGKANYSFNIPNNSQTKFKIGSISKQFTAAAILILEQEGYLSINDTLSKYFPNHGIAKGITIEQLLNHTSGLTDIYNVPDFNKLSCDKITIAELSELILNAGLQFEPGNQYQYSNGGYAVLAQIIEQVSRLPYEDYLSKKIFVPLQMTSTGHGKNHEVVSNLAIGYDPLNFDDVRVTDFLDNELLKGSGSLHSSNKDLSIWINSIKNRSFLSSKSYDKFLNNYGNNYGLGISIYQSFGQSVFGHDGRINGYIADYLHYKEDDITIIILGNIQTGVADFFRRDIAAILFEKAYDSRAKKEIPSGKMPKNPEKIFGVYSFGPNFKVYVDIIDGRIQVRANEGAYSELIPLVDGRYFNRTLYAYIQFVEVENSIKMIWTNNDGNSFEGIKSG